MADIKFLVTQERIERNISVDEMIGLQEGKLRAIADVLSRFVLAETGTGWMDPKAARKLIGAMNTVELNDAYATFNAQKLDAILPEPGAAS